MAAFASTNCLSYINLPEILIADVDIENDEAKTDAGDDLFEEEDEVSEEREHNDCFQTKGLRRKHFMASSSSITGFFLSERCEHAGTTMNNFLDNENSPRNGKSSPDTKEVGNVSTLCNSSVGSIPGTRDSRLARLWVTLLDGKAGRPVRRALWVEIYSGGTVLDISDELREEEQKSLVPTFAVFYRELSDPDSVKDSVSLPSYIDFSSSYCLSLRSTRVEEQSPTTLSVVTHYGEGHTLLIEVPRPEDLPVWSKVFQPERDSERIRDMDYMSGKPIFPETMVCNSNGSIYSKNLAGNLPSIAVARSLPSPHISPKIPRRHSLEPLSELSELTDKSC